MGMEYWPIVGYGVRLTPDMVDPGKAARFMGTNDYFFHELLEKLCHLPEGRLLIWASTGEMGCEELHYLYCPALVPWKAAEEPWKGATREQVERAIRAVLAPLLRDGLNAADLEFDEIFDVGCG